jgi:TPR repeat protein
VEPDLAKAEEYARAALVAGFVRAHRVLSEVLADRRRNEEALAELKAGAEAGDEDAMTAYAAALQKGRFGPPDPRQAVEWMQKAAKRGVPSAQRDIAKAIMMNYAGLPTNANNDDFGREMLERAAAANDPEALRLLARVRLTGELRAPFEPDKAIESLNQAIKLNDAASHYDLAIYYVEGLIVPRDLDRARTLMRRAEALGFKPASIYLRRLDRPEPEPR